LFPVLITVRMASFEICAHILGAYPHREEFRMLR
jgi:hypothetical protein